jgi:hypothetical protein
MSGELMMNFPNLPRNTTVKRFVSSLLPLALCALLLNACVPAASKDTSAAALMPNLPDYNVATTLDIQDAIVKLAGASSLATGQVEITAAVAAASGLLACYQSAGALEGRTYVNKADPLKAGLVVIINRNVVTDPNTLLGCVAPRNSLSAAAKPAVQPCLNNYTLVKPGNQFYIGYVGTNPEVCAAFCSALDSCTP